MTAPGKTSCWIWGLPLAPVTMQEALDQLDRLIQLREPSYAITANLHYAMLTAREPRLRQVNAEAALIVADGMPFVWASRLRKVSLPERVTGADLVPRLCERAAQHGYGIFLFGAAPGVADEAARRLGERFAGLRIVGTLAPPYREWTADERADILGKIQAAKPDILFVAFGQPKGEIWVADHYRQLGVPLSIQIGGSLDFAAGRVRRAPRWIQRTGLEWIYRIYQEPRRLLGRYITNGLFLLRMLLKDITDLVLRRR